ncbi:3-hydroxyacyl-ACP dehydratase FabZ family protein [Ruficoccus sp. ZRK36]|uniref:3-hydroxyacyl-ACP dehydratase FabZ family protein n=1 Tax=Ruficoccus sp. ZRK36 TaxID=2866311 RepID=UPI001C73AEC8|nr:3-hydroxyacyl-ACP dehydratase FabZ family protein [Ruficoccus sp. ZRK36]QYY35178.1 beta-hydroxyacyl-ACP dehydratase [Ruficoccus sp. ZRK36]
MNDLVKTIPHRPPFLFVDEVDELREDGITARRTLRADEFYFEGHYPGNPLMPGVLLCESAFQTAAIYLVKRMEGAGVDMANRTPILSRIMEAKFKNMVRPGEAFIIDVSYTKTMADFHFLKAVIKREDGKTAVTLEFVLAMIKAEA